jgi:hypothetical protein
VALAQCTAGKPIISFEPFKGKLLLSKKKESKRKRSPAQFAERCFCMADGVVFTIEDKSKKTIQ